MTSDGRTRNVFIIPSWFPSSFQPLHGSFTKEQAEALADCSSSRYRYIVSDWGFNDTEVTFRSPADAFKKIIHFFGRKKNHYYQRNNVHYIENPYLNLSEKLPWIGSFERLVGVHLKSIRKAESLFGKIDLLHAHVSYPAGYLSAKLSARLKIPYIITEHMSPFPFVRLRRNGNVIPEIDEALRNANAVIAVSDAHADQIKSYGFSRPNVIPNLVNEALFQPPIQPLPEKPFTFFSLGFLEKRKGIHDLITAISIWNPSPDEVRFEIGGDGEELASLQAQAESRKISHLITWHGDITREDASERMKECHAFVLPSYEESFGVVYAEALACGKPVIATRCGGPESIVNEMNGLLVPVGEPVELCSALQNMVKMRGEYDSEWIRKDFERRFSRKSVTDQIAALYDKVLSNETW